MRARMIAKDISSTNALTEACNLFDSLAEVSPQVIDVAKNLFQDYKERDHKARGCKTRTNRQTTIICAAILFRAHEAGCQAMSLKEAAQHCGVLPNKFKLIRRVAQSTEMLQAVTNLPMKKEERSSIVSAAKQYLERFIRSVYIEDFRSGSITEELVADIFVRASLLLDASEEVFQIRSYQPLTLAAASLYLADEQIAQLKQIKFKKNAVKEVGRCFDSTSDTSIYRAVKWVLRPCCDQLSHGDVNHDALRVRETFIARRRNPVGFDETGVGILDEAETAGRSNADSTSPMSAGHASECIAGPEAVMAPFTSHDVFAGIQHPVCQSDIDDILGAPMGPIRQSDIDIWLADVAQ